MFDSDLDREPTHEGATNLRRRAFIASAAAAIGGLALWQWKRPAILNAAPTALPEPKEVTIVLFSDSGQRLKKVQIAKVIKTAAEWRQQLPSGVFDITRSADTEIAFTGKYWNLHDKGIYRCICCDNALFDSSTKFESGTGWPSFWGPIAAENVTEIRDATFRHGSHCSRLHRMRFSPRPRLRRRPRTHRSPILHEFRLPALREARIAPAVATLRNSISPPHLSS
jgi:peptide-methionine (R)-S-oxide reductase